MTVDLDGSWRMQVSLSVRTIILNSRMGVHEALWDNYSTAYPRCVFFFFFSFLHTILWLCGFVFMQTHFGSCERVGE